MDEFLFTEFSLRIQNNGKIQKRPTSHRVISFDWSAGIPTQSSCCGSSSVPAGHEFWPQNARTLQDKIRMNKKWQPCLQSNREREDQHKDACKTASVSCKVNMFYFWFLNHSQNSQTNDKEGKCTKGTFALKMWHCVSFLFLAQHSAPKDQLYYLST